LDEEIPVRLSGIMHIVGEPIRWAPSLIRCLSPLSYLAPDGPPIRALVLARFSRPFRSRSCRRSLPDSVAILARCGVSFWCVPRLVSGGEGLRCLRHRVWGDTSPTMWYTRVDTRRKSVNHRQGQDLSGFGQMGVNGASTPVYLLKRNDLAKSARPRVP
jgi:hypothetical protein